MNKSVHERLNKIKLDEINKSIEDTNHNEKKRTNLRFIKSRVYFFFLNPTGLKGFIYHLFIFTIIFGSILIGSLSTIKKLDNWSFKTLWYYEIIITLYFCFEIILRCWSSSYNLKYSGVRGLIKLITQSFILVEIFLIIISFFSFSLYYFLNEKNYTNIYSVLRFVQIARYLYADKNVQTWSMLYDVCLKHRNELVTTFFIGVFILLLSAYLVLLFEKPYSESNDDNQFHSYSDALYWAIITMTTIGFGKNIYLESHFIRFRDFLFILLSKKSKIQKNLLS